MFNVYFLFVLSTYLHNFNAMFYISELVRNLLLPV